MSTTQESLLPNLSLQLPRGVVDCRASVGWLTLIHVLHISCPPVCLHGMQAVRETHRRQRGRQKNTAGGAERIRSAYMWRLHHTRFSLCVSLQWCIVWDCLSSLLTPLWPTMASVKCAALSSQHVCTQQLWDSAADNQQQVAVVPTSINGRRYAQYTSVVLQGVPIYRQGRHSIYLCFDG